MLMCPSNRKGTRLKSKRKLGRFSSELLSGSSRVDVNGWIFLRTRGDAYQLGFQHGKLLASEIVSAIGAVRLLGEGGYKRSWQFFCESAMELFWPKLPEEYKDEISGIVDGVRADGIRNVRLEDIVALNGYFDIVSYHYWLKSKEIEAKPQTARAEHCSVFIATGNNTSSGQIVLAHNTWFQYITGAKYNTIIDVSPAKGAEFVMQAMPGTISSGTDWCISKTGMVVSEATISGMTTFNQDGLPYFLRSRKAIQHAKSIDQWVKTMVTGNNGGYANDWLIGDTNTGEIAWLELGTFRHKLKRTRNGAFVGSNLALSDEVRSETAFNYEDKSGSCTARYERLNQLIKSNEGKISVELAKTLLADHHDSYTNKDTPNRNTICGHIESDQRGLPEWEYGPNYPGGTFDAKATDTELAKRGAFWGHWGRPCDTPFMKEQFLVEHPEYEWQRRGLQDIRTYPWTLFSTWTKL